MLPLIPLEKNTTPHTYDYSGRQQKDENYRNLNIYNATFSKSIIQLFNRAPIQMYFLEAKHLFPHTTILFESSIHLICPFWKGGLIGS